MLTRQAVARMLFTVAVAIGVVSAHSPAIAASAPESYVAMGDSFTAGPLISNQLPDPPGCWRSDHNYPHLVAAALGATLRDRSCSGARTRDLQAPQAVLGGPNPPQLDALDAGVDVITVQIGGNDIGFAEILARCFALLPLGSPCTDFYTSGGVDEISRRIAAAAPKVRAVLAEASQRSPQARVFVLGYPSILPEVQPGCWPLLPIAPGDAPYLREKHKELNVMLASEAATAGATYVDVYTPSVGHDACELPGVRWVEPAIPLSPAAPVHPNAVGMEGMAVAVRAAMATWAPESPA